MITDMRSSGSGYGEKNLAEHLFSSLLAFVKTWLLHLGSSLLAFVKNLAREITSTLLTCVNTYEQTPPDFRRALLAVVNDLTDKRRHLRRYRSLPVNVMQKQKPAPAIAPSNSEF
jgi:hypothetical protein